VTTSKTHCLPLEDLASLAEGRLVGAERARALSHLAECDSCRELLAEALAVFGEAGHEGTSGGGAGSGDSQRDRLDALSTGRRVLGDTSRFVRSHRRLAAVAALAAALLLVGGPIAYRALVPPRPPERAGWLASMPSAHRLVPHLWEGVTLRGEAGGGAGLRQATELGALLVDLEVALAGNAAPERASELARRMASIMTDAGLVDEEAAALRALAAQHPAPTAGLYRRELEVLEPALRDRFSGLHLDLGSFLEQARLAALAGEGELFAQRRTRRYVKWLHSQPVASSPFVRARLATLLGESSLEQRATACDELLRELTR
jgi:hypothetical protein